MFIHPEQKPNEVFFTNCSTVQFDEMVYTTKRTGTVAYDGEGFVLNIINWFPVFIEQEELNNSKINIKEARKIFRYQHEKV
jgi:hypothetical protein